MVYSYNFKTFKTKKKIFLYWHLTYTTAMTNNLKVNLILVLARYWSILMKKEI